MSDAIEIMDELWPYNEALELGLTDFSKKRLQHTNIAPMHEDWDNKLTEMYEGLGSAHGPKYGLLLAPFLHGKSVRVGINFPLWCFLRNPELRILNVSAVEAQAKRQVSAVFGTINRYYKWLKPKEYTEGPWSAGSFAVKRKGIGIQEPSYSALGLFGSTIEGGHWDIIIADDVVTQANSRTPHQRRMTSDWFKMTLMGRIATNGILVVIGSRWHQRDLYYEILEMADLLRYFSPPSGFITTHKAVLEWKDGVVGGTPVKIAWPEKTPGDGGWTPERILERWNILGSIFAQLRMQNNPQPAEGTMLKAEWIQRHAFEFQPYGQRGELPETRYLRQGVIPVDPAFSTKEPGDWCAIACLVADRTGTIWLANVGHYHKVWTDFLTQDLGDYYRYWTEAVGQIPWVIVVEENSFGTRTEFEAQMKLLKQHKVLANLPMVSTRTTQNKETRVGTRAPFYENGTVRVRYVHTMPGDPFHDEFVGFPLADHDDTVDVVDIGLQRLLGDVRPPYKSMVF